MGTHPVLTQQGPPQQCSPSPSETDSDAVLEAASEESSSASQVAAEAISHRDVQWPLQYLHRSLEAALFH